MPHKCVKSLFLVRIYDLTMPNGGINERQNVALPEMFWVGNAQRKLHVSKCPYLYNKELLEHVSPLI